MASAASLAAVQSNPIMTAKAVKAKLKDIQRGPPPARPTVRIESIRVVG